MGGRNRPPCRGSRRGWEPAWRGAGKGGEGSLPERLGLLQSKLPGGTRTPSTVPAINSGWERRVRLFFFFLVKNFPFLPSSTTPFVLMVKGWRDPPWLGCWGCPGERGAGREGEKPSHQKHQPHDFWRGWSGFLSLLLKTHISPTTKGPMQAAFSTVPSTLRNKNFLIAY